MGEMWREMEGALLAVWVEDGEGEDGCVREEEPRRRLIIAYITTSSAAAADAVYGSEENKGIETASVESGDSA